MQKITRLFVRSMASAVLVGTMFSSAQAQSFLTNGLVGFYPFDGNANDASGSGNDGIVAGPTMAADRFGEPSGAYRFASFGQKITTAHAYGFPVLSNDFAVSFWVNVSSNTFNPQIFICNGSTEQFQIHIGSLTSSQTQLAFQTGGTGAGATPVIPWLLNRWYNVQVVRFQNTNIIIYRDGVQLSKQTSSLKNLASITNQNLIFGYRPSPQNQFYGTLDDIRIYNRALSPLEVAQLYQYESGSWVTLLQAVKPSFSHMTVGANYQLQVSGNLVTWTNQGAAFTATNSTMIYPQYFDADWGSLFFRTQVAP